MTTEKEMQEEHFLKVNITMGELLMNYRKSMEVNTPVADARRTFKAMSPDDQRELLWFMCIAANRAISLLCAGEDIHDVVSFSDGVGGH